MALRLAALSVGIIYYSCRILSMRTKGGELGMKKYFAIILALVFASTVALVGCEKKAEAPKPAEQSAVTPTVPPAPAPAAPAPAPAPAKPAKK